MVAQDKGEFCNCKMLPKIDRDSYVVQNTKQINIPFGAFLNIQRKKKRQRQK